MDIKSWLRFVMLGKAYINMNSGDGMMEKRRNKDKLPVKTRGRTMIKESRML